MTKFARAKLKWNVMAYGGGILFSAAIMSWLILGLALAARP